MFTAAWYGRGKVMSASGVPRGPHWGPGTGLVEEYRYLLNKFNAKLAVYDENNGDILYHHIWG